ncbi:MAG: DUF4942 domain-containing protein [Paludibacteraceae bacterium]|nr:DUF4942 domain-containing protein [Paludibacteraceae bacterium]MCK9615742.1 DUF4942 domain-containing protein [Candidatus Omnitrophota bacterium]
MNLLEEVKTSGQDFEWYPTTDEMISVVAKKLCEIYDHSKFSCLDVGAGDGRVLSKIHEEFIRDYEEYSKGYYGISQKFAIEKSSVLLQNLPEDVIILGTEFNNQTLIDKNVDVIFSNPPYSEFESWASRIILESNCNNIFLIIPQRWKDSVKIKLALEKRNSEAEILFSGDFQDAERKARANIDILYINLNGGKSRDHVDPFDLWFNETFKFSTPEVIKEEKKKDKKDELVGGRNQIEVLVELYLNGLSKLIENYQNVSKIDPEILREIGVNVSNVKIALKEKVNGLKKHYWEELFSRLESVTKRLTSKTRNEMLYKMNQYTGIDFTTENVYAIVMWALKNANKYIDSQLLDVYKDMTREENAQAYKSNVHMTKDTWRYCRSGDERASHYSLDYRIVLCHWSALESYSHQRRLSTRTAGMINDIFTIANNLGFDVINDSYERDWEYGQLETFYFKTEKKDKDFKQEVFCTIRIYKNGNIHLKFNQKFMKAMNIEAGRLLGWLKSSKQASEEMRIDEEEAESLFLTNIQIKTLPLLTA